LHRLNSIFAGIRSALSFPNHIPLQQIQAPGALKLYVLRLDTIDRYAGGNKFFKLKYNLEAAWQQGHSKILTFGGAWSNHLAALATAVHSPKSMVGGQQPEMIAVVRGEEPGQLSDTLQFCKDRGMQLHFVSREEYRKKNDPEFIDKLKEKFGNFYLLSEGGSNELAVKGCREILDHINIGFDHICCPVGSGGTIAGIASGLKEGQQAHGFVALKGGEYLERVIRGLLIPLSPNSATSLLKGEKLISAPNLQYDYHFGGFAKITPGLISFKKEFEKQNGFELDYVYTAKMFFGIFDLLKKDIFKPGSTIVALHTGGLQGNKGFKEL